MSSLIAASDVAQGDNGHISSTLVFTMVGCLLAFVFIVLGFLLVARKSCCVSRRSDADESLPSHHDSHHLHAHPPAMRRGCPVASLCDFQCTHCLKRGGDKGNDRAPRVSLESLSSPPPPYPPPAPALPLPSALLRGPTSWLPLPRSGSVPSFDRASAITAPPATPAVTASAPPPSYRYASRGPVGGPAPRYRQS